jgi:hypothetical protein
MKVEVKMYTVECDLCKNQHIDDHNGFVGWTEYERARESAMDSDWLEDWRQGCEQKHYCPECYSLNDEAEVVCKRTGMFLFN